MRLSNVRTYDADQLTIACIVFTNAGNRSRMNGDNFGAAGYTFASAKTRKSAMQNRKLLIVLAILGLAVAIFSPLHLPKQPLTMICF